MGCFGLWHRGDQRLSASKIFAPKRRGHRFSSSKCDQRLSASKIFAPWKLVMETGISKVINAFRHQRFLHQQKADYSRYGSMSDQRLSASKIFALNQLHENVRPSAAVINAFRHQRFLHPMASDLTLSSEVSVINAFRHQRFLHSC